MRPLFGWRTLATVTAKRKIIDLDHGRGPCQPAAMTSSTRPIIEATAACACAAIELTLNGPVLSMLLCSCLDCQKASGTGHSCVALVPVETLSIGGTPKSFDRPSDSGATFTRYFCPDCGTPLYGQSSRAAEIRMIPAGLFAGSNGWFEPSQLIFARSHEDWDTIPEDLPRHERYRLPRL